MLATVQFRMSFFLVSKNLKIEIYKTVLVSGVSVKLVLSHYGKNID